MRRANGRCVPRADAMTTYILIWLGGTCTVLGVQIWAYLASAKWPLERLRQWVLVYGAMTTVGFVAWLAHALVLQAGANKLESIMRDMPAPACGRCPPRCLRCPPSSQQSIADEPTR